MFNSPFYERNTIKIPTHREFMDELRRSLIQNQDHSDLSLVFDGSNIAKRLWEGHRNFIFTKEFFPINEDYTYTFLTKTYFEGLFNFFNSLKPKANIFKNTIVYFDRSPTTIQKYGPSVLEVPGEWILEHFKHTLFGFYPHLENSKTIKYDLKMVEWGLRYLENQYSLYEDALKEQQLIRSISLGFNPSHGIIRLLDHPLSFKK